MHDFGGLGEVSVPLGNAFLGTQVLELCLLVADALDCGALVLPAQMHGIPGILQVCILAVDLLQTGLGGLVVFLRECLLLDLELHEFPLDLIQFLGLTLDLDLQLACSLINQVDCLIRKEPVGDVPVGKDCSSHKGIVLDTHTVVNLVAVLDSAQDGNGVLNRRFRGKYRLETSLQRLVFLDVLAVLIQCRGSNGMQFTTGQSGLDEVGGIGRTLCSSRSHYGVKLIYEEDYLALAACNLIDNGLQTLLELTAEFGSGHKGSDIKRKQALVLQ